MAAEMLLPRRASVAAALSVLLAIGALLFLVWWPDFYQGETVQLGPDGTSEVTRSSESLIEHEGLGILWFLVLPAGLAVTGFMASLRPTLSGKVGVWLAAVPLAGFAFVTSLSIGPFYYPAAMALLLSAFTHRRHTSDTRG